MLINSKLLRSFWAETMSTACYLVNISPSPAIGFKTLEEMWSERLEKYDNLRIFGYLECAHLVQSKLEPRTLKGVFVGYPDGVKGYKIWCGQPKKCIISSDVIFNEASMIIACKKMIGIYLHIDGDISKPIESFNLR